MRNEKFINVPLSPDVKEKLERLADSHGRATIREAAVVLADYVLRHEESEKGGER